MKLIVLAFMALSAFAGINDEFLGDGVLHDLSNPELDDDSELEAENDRRRLAFGDILRLYGALDGRTAGRKYCGEVPNYLAMDKQSCKVAADDLSKEIYRTRCKWQFIDMDDQSKWTANAGGGYIVNQGEGVRPISVSGSTSTDLVKTQMAAGCIFQLSRKYYATVNVYWNSRTDVLAASPVDNTANKKLNCGFQSDQDHYNARCLCLKCDQAYCYNRAYPPTFSATLTQKLPNHTGADTIVVGARKYQAYATDAVVTGFNGQPDNDFPTSGHAHSMIQSWMAGTCDCTCWLNGNYFGRRCDEMNSQFSCSAAKQMNINSGPSGGSWAYDLERTAVADNFVNSSTPEYQPYDGFVTGCCETASGQTTELKSVNRQAGGAVNEKIGAEGFDTKVGSIKGDIQHYYSLYLQSASGNKKRYLDPQLKYYYLDIEKCDDYETYAYDKQCWVHGPNKCSKNVCCKNLPIDTCATFMDGNMSWTAAGTIKKKMTYVTINGVSEWKNAPWESSFGSWIAATNADGSINYNEGVVRTCKNADNQRLRGDVDSCYDLTGLTTDGRDVPNKCGVDYCCEAVPEVHNCSELSACSEHGCAYSTGDDWVLDTVTRFWDATLVCPNKDECTATDCCVDPTTMPTCQSLPIIGVDKSDDGYAFVSSTVTLLGSAIDLTNYPTKDRAQCSLLCTGNSLCDAWVFRSKVEQESETSTSGSSGTGQQAVAAVAETCLLYKAASKDHPILYQKKADLGCSVGVVCTKLFTCGAGNNEECQRGRHAAGLRCATTKKHAYTAYTQNLTNDAGVNYPTAATGGATPTGSQGTITQWECERRCDIDPNCKYYVMDLTSGSTCFLKTSNTNAYAHSPANPTNYFAYEKKVDASGNATEYSEVGARVSIGVYPNYFGSIGVTGEIRIFDQTDLNTSVNPHTLTNNMKFTWSLTGLESWTGAPAVAATGKIAIHEGTTCTDETKVGAAFYNTAVAQSTAYDANTYTVEDVTGNDFEGTGKLVKNGYNLHAVMGRVVVVYDKDGSTKIGCGIIRPLKKCLTRNAQTERAESYWTCPPGRELKRKGKAINSQGAAYTTYNDVSREDVLLGGEFDDVAGPIWCDGTQQNCDERCCTRDNFCELKDLITVAGEAAGEDNEEDMLRRQQRTLDSVNVKLDACEVQLDRARAESSSISISAPIAVPSIDSMGQSGYIILYVIVCALAFVLTYSL